jgi:hypothetical protein
LTVVSLHFWVDRFSAQQTRVAPPMRAIDVCCL